MTRGGKRYQVSRADAAAYLTKARSWLDAASESLAAERWDVAAGGDGQAASRQLAQLLRFKTPAQYDPVPMASADARKAVELANRLVERAASLLGSRGQKVAHHQKRGALPLGYVQRGAEPCAIPDSYHQG